MKISRKDVAMKIADYLHHHITLVSSQPYNVVKYISYVPHIQLEGIKHEEIHRDAY
jgi:hypothetical protein